MEERFDHVDQDDKIIGIVSRDEVHGNPELIHRVAHVLVFNSSGALFLQKRAMNKIVQPGKWDTSVGGHVDLGESYPEAAVRETREELGISAEPDSFEFLYKYLHRNSFESEYVSTYRLVWDGEISIQESEIEDGRFWNLSELFEAAEGVQKDIFTPNFLDELKRYLGIAKPARL